MLEIKTVVVGDTDAGKTSLSERFCHGDAPLTANPTIGASFLQKRLSIVNEHGVDSRTVTLQLWDTAGQERFRSMAPMYYRGAMAAIIVFDLSKEGAWEGIKTWHKDLVAYAEPGVVIAVAGNKIDMLQASSSNLDECRAICAGWGASLHLTSAITGEGVNDLFRDVAERAAASVTQQHRNPPPVALKPEHKSAPCC